MKNIKFVELFAGIGGFRYGLEKAGKYEYVWANEWDKYAVKIYEKNFGEKPNTRDIRTVEANEVPNHDLLTAGFPCQAFSIAGHRKGFEDTRGTLFFDIARILNTKRPRFLLLENVRGLLSHDKGRTFKIILSTLDELGYDLQWQVLNSKNFGVPQNRERLFIIGHIRGTSRPKIFPIRESNALSEKSGKKREIKNTFATAITSNYKRGVHSGGETLIKIGINGTDAQANRIYDIKGISATLQGLAGGKGAKTGLYDVSKTIRTGGRGSLTQKHSWDIVKEKDLKIRRLTPIECERLQGFPDNWTEGISDTQRYKCLGNAVTTNVITEIGKRLIEENEEDSDLESRAKIQKSGNRKD